MLFRNLDDSVSKNNEKVKFQKFPKFEKFQKFCRDTKFFLRLVLIVEIKFELKIDKDCSIKLVPSSLSGHFEFS